eukprot:Skav220133  [mRNA]  locus=scaffold4510:65975:71915:+ [translate_table: standard]
MYDAVAEPTTPRGTQQLHRGFGDSCTIRRDQVLQDMAWPVIRRKVSSCSQPLQTWHLWQGLQQQLQAAQPDAIVLKLKPHDGFGASVEAFGDGFRSTVAHLCITDIQVLQWTSFIQARR